MVDFSVLEINPLDTIWKGVQFNGLQRCYENLFALVIVVTCCMTGTLLKVKTSLVIQWYIVSQRWYLSGTCELDSGELAPPDSCVGLNHASVSMYTEKNNLAFLPFSRQIYQSQVDHTSYSLTPWHFRLLQWFTVLEGQTQNLCPKFPAISHSAPNLPWTILPL